MKNLSITPPPTTHKQILNSPPLNLFLKTIFIITFFSISTFAQLRTEPEDPNLSLTAVGVDLFQFWFDNFNDFDPMSAVYSAWAEHFSVRADFGYVIEKYDGNSWFQIINDTIAWVPGPSNGTKYVFDGTIYFGQKCAPYGNGTFRGKGWVHAWYIDTYDESNWDTCIVNDVVAPQTPTTFSGSWTNGHPTLTISGNSEYDFHKYNIYKKVDNGNWHFNGYTTSNTYIDYSETQYTPGNKTKRYVYYKAKAVDYTENESDETSALKFVCNSQMSKNNAKQNQNNNLITKFNLSQNYPNPFNPTTKINFSIGKNSFVELSVYNILGKKIKTLLKGYKNPGHYSVVFDASNLAAGIYIYKLTTNYFNSIKKMILVK